MTSLYIVWTIGLTSAILAGMETYPKFCTRCGKQRPVKGRKRCGKCQEEAREYQRKKKETIPAGVCRKCGKRTALAGYRQCAHCRQILAGGMRKWRKSTGDHWNRYQRDRNRKRRRRVIEHYGGECACCGEKTFEFLAVDHINGGGDAHRRKVGSGSNMIEWIITSNFPDIFQVLCHNCNQAIGYYGSCPHRDITQ